MDLEHRQLSSKYSKSREEKESANVEIEGETLDDNIKEEKEKENSKTTDQQRSKDLSHESESNSDSEGEIDVIDRSKNNNHSDTHINVSSSSSSSWSESSSEYKFFTVVEAFNNTKSGKDNVFSSESSEKSEVDNNLIVPTSSDYKFLTIALNNTKSGKDNDFSSERSEKSEVDNNLIVPTSSDYKFFTIALNNTNSGKDNDSSSERSEKSEVDNNLIVPTSTCQSHNQNDMSPTASPSIQVMDRSGRYDTSRIPSSIFEANTNPSEWSLASNDSLFSIPMGHPSFFTRANTPLFDESYLSRAPSVIQEEITSTSIKTSVDVENQQIVEIPYGSFKLEGETLVEGDNEIEISPQPTTHKPSKSNVSLISQTSDNAKCSAPVPVKKRTRKLANFYNCRWVFCDMWSRWECSNRCGFSCCWKRNHTKHRHCSSQILKKVESSDSMKKTAQESKANSSPSITCCNSFCCPFCGTWKISCCC